MPRRGRYGASFALAKVGRSGDDVSRPLRPRSPGINRGQGEGWAERGGIRSLTLIEAYERNSDYRRWRAGMEIWFGDRDGWAAGQVGWLARLKSGPVGDIIPLTTTLFPSRGSAEATWHVTARPRGAILLPMPLQAGQLSLDRGDPDPAEHRLIYDVRGVLNRTRLAVWNNLVGDQFEDSATDAIYPAGLIEDPVDAVALTLVEVDVSDFRLIFDLSRPYVRRRVGSRTYWKRAPYDPHAPLYWQADGSRHLASSHRFECSCPDYQGRAISNLQTAGAALSDRFPIPAAGRELEGTWEGQALGYAKKWRDLDVRADRRRECKHIHSVRWEAQVPFDEPSDSPLLSGPAEGRLLEGTPIDFEEAGKFYGRQLLSFDRLLLGVAPLIGLNLDADGELRGQSPTFRPVNQPILWNDPVMPVYAWCRQNDWWLPRGKAEAWLFDPPSGGFVKQLDGRDVLERVPITGSSLDIPLLIGGSLVRFNSVQGSQGLLVARLGVRKPPRGSLVGYGGLGLSRLVRDADLGVTMAAQGSLLLQELYAAPVANLIGALRGRGGLGSPGLFARPPVALALSLAGAGRLDRSLVYSPAVRLVLNGVLIGTGGLGAQGLFAKPPVVLSATLAGAGRLDRSSVIRVAADSGYWGSWRDQQYGWEAIVLIDWWGS